MSVFCRHNRFTAECPICSKGTVLEAKPAAAARGRAAGAGEPARRKTETSAFSGPHGSTGPYTDEHGATYTVRLEKVPGGLRLGEWDGSKLRKRAPTLPTDDLPSLIEAAGEVIPDAQALRNAMTEDGPAVSKGRAGDFAEELRSEDLGDGRVRVARWVNRPGSGWERQDAPVMLPAKRFAEALRGVVSSL